MPILNYTTQVDVFKTIGELQQKLAHAGARAVNVLYDAQGQPEALTFAIELQGQLVNFRLPSRWQGVLAALEAEGVASRLRTEDQARRVAWRIVKDWTEAQLAIIAAGLAELAEVFLPYAITPQGQTFFEVVQSRGLLLTDGKGR